MIRRIQININYSNVNKLRTLDVIFEESKRVVNLYIDKLWESRDFSSRFVGFKVDSWLSARLQQCLGKQALEIVKSQRRKKKKIKPKFKKDVINLDSRFIDIKFDLSKKFDIFVKINSIGNKLNLKLPSKKHMHFNRLISDKWYLRKSCRLRKSDNGYFIDLYVEKRQPELRKSGRVIGLDIGYKKLVVTSDNRRYDAGLERVYEKISRKRQVSKGFRKALRERDNLINRSVNDIDLDGVKVIVVEDLKNVKKNSRKKKTVRKKFMNKLQRWSYPKVLDKLSMVCEEVGIDLVRVNPAYTSQTCSKCGFSDKKNRDGETFNCLRCGYLTDADYNASINILQRGAYSPSSIPESNNNIHY